MVATDVCVVGAGAAGITLALELAGKGARVVLLESGGLRREDASNRLNAGESDGIPYGPLESLRSRMLGGSTNCWGGWSRPLEPEDFETRSWVRNSGWPVSYSDLVPFYEQASQRLLLGPLGYDRATVERIRDPRATLVPLDGRRVESLLLRFSPPARFGTLYLEPLRRASNVRCLLHANAVELETSADGRRVETVRVATLGGKTFDVKPRIVALAAGGIENPRLLLLSNRSSPGGLGNSHDLVGRYFMEHPSLPTGYFNPSTGAQSLALYDSAFNYHNPAFAVDGVAMGSFFAATPQVQREEELLRHRVFLNTTFRGEHEPGTQALKRLIGRTPVPAGSTHRARELATVIGDAPSVVTAFVGRRLKILRLAQRVDVHTIVEPEPIPESRVTLGDTRCALGLPRARVTWKLSSRVSHTFHRATEIVGEELAHAGIGRIEVLALEEEVARPQWCWHHMGTTRMSADPKRGVVDPDCRVHSISNLYVAGSSVFPTAGCDMPTLTIVALAIRMAAHLESRLDRRLVD